MVPHLWALSKLSPKLLHMVLMYQNDTVITQGSGAHNTYTSSTRMELEAIRRALQSLCGLNDYLKSVIFATDSMAVLTRIQSGCLPDSW